MQLRHVKTIVAILASSALLVEGYALLARRGHHMAAIYNSAGVLAALLSDWNREGKPRNAALMKLLTNYGTYKPFVFTNTISIGGTDYRCLFAVRNEGFAKRGVVAITPERLVIWTGDGGDYIVELGRRNGKR